MHQRKRVMVSATRHGTVVFALLAVISATAAAVPAKNARCAAWHDDFNGSQLDPRWRLGNGQAPGYIPNEHLGLYQPQNVLVSGGVLSMKLTQELGLVDGTFGVVSRGALISTTKVCGYGTYEWSMRMSSTASTPTNPGVPVSGSVSAGFIYVNNSQTEIDFEFPAADPTALYLVNWLNPVPSRDPTGANETFTAVRPFDAASAFHTYRFVWQAGMILFYIDDQLRARHTTHVPSAAAYFMINHWGTDSVNWGGTATPGTDRYFYIDRVSYTPLQ